MALRHLDDADPVGLRAAASANDPADAGVASTAEHARGTPDPPAAPPPRETVPPASHIRARIANAAERSTTRATLGGRFARNGEMAAQILQLETTMDALAEQAGVSPVVAYVFRFTESARVVEHAISLGLRTALALLTRHGVLPPESLFGCVDAVHAWFFDLAEHVAELLELQATASGTFGIPGRFLPEYSASFVSCKIEPRVEELLVELEALRAREDLGELASTMSRAVDRLCRAVTLLNDGLRNRA